MNSLFSESGEEADTADTGKVAEPVQPRAGARKRKLREEDIQRNIASMMYVELLFWKPPAVAEDVSTGYNWRVRLWL